jgi:hypothetical protein
MRHGWVSSAVLWQLTRSLGFPQLLALSEVHGQAIRDLVIFCLYRGHVPAGIFLINFCQTLRVTFYQEKIPDKTLSGEISRKSLRP